MEPIRVYDNPPRDAWPALTARVTRDDAEIDRRVAAILNEVRTGGDEALRRIARRIDGFAPERFELPQAQLDEAARNISSELKTALATAKANIEAFHRAQLPRPVAVEVMPGVRCSQRAVAIRRVGLYVPGGSAPLFSTVLMLAVPAAIAGCAEIVLCTPAGRDGSIAPEIRYAAALCGVRRVFALGGAQAVAAMFEQTGPVDLLVNNAGIAVYGLLTDLDPDVWQRLFDVNVTGTYNCCRFAIPPMVHEKAGHIINLTSILGMNGASCEAAYSATKGAIVAFTKAMAKELGPSGIRVNCVAPGCIDTDMIANLSPEDKAELAESTSLGRMGTAEEVGDAIALLASERARFVTGQVFGVDGGLLI